MVLLYKLEVMMPKRLENIHIKHISLVRKGANGRVCIYKSAESDPKFGEVEVRIAKSDEERGILYGIVYSPDEVDAQGDFATAGEIENAAYRFMKSANTANVDLEHNQKKAPAFVAESWLVKKGDPIFPDEKPGAWAVAVKLEADDLKEAVRKGEITGFSMGGSGQRVEVEKSVDAENGIMKSLHRILKKLAGSAEKASPEIAKSDSSARTDELEKSVLELAKTVELQAAKIESLEKSLKETGEELKKSRQDEGPHGNKEDKQERKFFL